LVNEHIDILLHFSIIDNSLTFRYSLQGSAFSEKMEKILIKLNMFSIVCCSVSIFYKNHKLSFLNAGMSTPSKWGAIWATISRIHY